MKPSMKLLLGLVLAIGTKLASAQTFDIYGGINGRPCSNATGHFTLAKAYNRWWFCTAAGHVFTGMFFSNTFNNNPTVDGLGYNTFLIYGIKYAYGTDTTGVGKNREWQMLKRATGWGFNGIGVESSVGYAWETCSGGDCPWPGGTQPIPVAAIAFMTPVLTGSSNRFNYLTEPFKDACYGSNTFVTSTGHCPEAYDFFDTKLATETSSELTNGNNSNNPVFQAAINNNPYVVGWASDDTDYFTGAGCGPDFVCGSVGANVGWAVMLASPVQTWSINGRGLGDYLFSADTKLHMKADATNPAHGTCTLSAPCSLRDYLYDEYSGSISSLNTAWGSNYTSFDSTGTTVSSESVGTGDGTTVTFTHTMAHTPVSPFTTTVTVGGTPMGGDEPWFKYSGTTNTGKLLGAPTTIKITAASQSGSNTTYTYTLNGNGNVVYTPESIVITGMADAGNNGTFTISSLGSGTFTVVNASGVTHVSQNGTGTIAQPLTSSTINYSTGAISITFNTAPANGEAITVSYIYGGWMAGGTGLMDESGGTGTKVGCPGSGTSTCWVGTNGFCLEGADSNFPTYFACTGGSSPYLPVPNANATFGADIDNWEAHLFAKYNLVLRTAIRAIGSNVPYFGADTYGGYGSPPFRTVLKGAAANVDAIALGDYEWYKPTDNFTVATNGSVEFPSTYQYLTKYAGDIPLLDDVFIPATADSDESFNPGNGPTSELPTQAVRGQMYYNTVNYLLTTPSYNADFPFVLFDQWAWQDFQSVNWGLVSLHDNAYDGHEAVNATVACDSNYTVDAGAMCGGEPATYGNSISRIASANALWYTGGPLTSPSSQNRLIILTPGALPISATETAVAPWIDGYSIRIDAADNSAGRVAVDTTTCTSAPCTQTADFTTLDTDVQAFAGTTCGASLRGVGKPCRIEFTLYPMDDPDTVVNLDTPQWVYSQAWATTVGASTPQHAAYCAGYPVDPSGLTPLPPTTGTANINSTTCGAGATQCTLQDIQAGVPAYWETPFLTFRENFYSLFLNYLKTASYLSQVDYIRVASGTGNENTITCATNAGVAGTGLESVVSPATDAGLKTAHLGGVATMFSYVNNLRTSLGLTQIALIGPFAMGVSLTAGGATDPSWALSEIAVPAGYSNFGVVSDGYKDGSAAGSDLVNILTAASTCVTPANSPTCTSSNWSNAIPSITGARYIIAQQCNTSDPAGGSTHCLDSSLSGTGVQADTMLHIMGLAAQHGINVFEMYSKDAACIANFGPQAPCASGNAIQNGYREAAKWWANGGTPNVARIGIQ